MEQINLKRCGITDEVGQPFFVSLLQYPNIRKIDISENLLGDTSGFLALRNARMNKFLIELNIERNLITYQL